MLTDLNTLQPGRRVRCTQVIRDRDRAQSASVEGVIERIESLPTGSWYAHGKNDRLWLKRVRLRKDDGEVTLLVVDTQTRIEVLE
jgi:hypothetical protein